MARFPELQGKVALITGAGRRAGLGEGIARRLLQEGCKVVLTDIGKVRGTEMPVTAVGTDEEMVQVAFSQRRKILRNTLGKWLEARGFAGEFDVQRRAEEVPVEEYVRLALELKGSAPSVRG